VGTRHPNRPRGDNRPRCRGRGAWLRCFEKLKRLIRSNEHLASKARLDSRRRLLDRGLNYVNDIVPDRVEHQIADRVQLELAHDIRAMSFGGFHAQSQRNRDLFRALTLSQQLYHFALAGA